MINKNYLLFFFIFICRLMEKDDEEDGMSDGKVEKQQFRNLIEARGLQKFRSFLFDMRRSIRKVMYRFNWWGPEIGLSSCMFKYAWYKYPIIPQTTYRMMGTARRMMTNFAYDFYQGFMEEQMRDHHRISNKVAETTAEDFENYQYEYYPDFKEMGPHASNLPQPFYSASNNKNNNNNNNQQQSLPNRRMDDIVEMLKNLEPKTKRNAKNNDMRGNTDNQQTLNQFRIVQKDGDDIKKFPMNYHDDTANKVNGTSNNGTVHNAKEDTNNKSQTDAKVVVESRSVVSKNGVTNRADYLIDRQYSYGSPIVPYQEGYQQHAFAPPENIYHHPSDHSGGAHYYKHEIDSNNNYDRPKPGWLSFNFEDIILEKLGLTPPGKSAKGSGIMKCSQFYIVSALWRTLEQFLIKT